LSKKKQIKNEWTKVVKEKPKLLINHVIKSIRVGDRTQMILQDSNLGRVSMQLDSILDRRMGQTAAMTRDRKVNQTKKLKKEQELLQSLRLKMAREIEDHDTEVSLNGVVPSTHNNSLYKSTQFRRHSQLNSQATHQQTSSQENPNSKRCARPQTSVGRSMTSGMRLYVTKKDSSATLSKTNAAGLQA